MYLKISPQLAQKLSLSPQMLQSIRLLSLSVTELEQVIRQELEENPVLEEKGETLEELSALEKEEQEQMEWTQYTSTGVMSSGVKEKDEQSYERYTPVEESLREHLMWQINFSDLSEEDRKILYCMVDEVDEDGYLRESLENISVQNNVDLLKVQQALKLLQEFDPPGIGAQNLQECLLIQIRRIPSGTKNIIDLIENHFDFLRTKNYEKIAGLMNLSVNEVRDMTQVIAGLVPKPGQMFSSHQTEYVIPDIYIYKKEDGNYGVTVNEEGMPQIKIASHYTKFLNQIENTQKNQDTQQFLTEKIKRALGFIRALNHRRNSILKVAQILAEEQVGFFEKGERYLHPLLLKEVAQKLGIHLSTVSRLTTNKYVHTPQGVFELKYFFGVSYLNGKGERQSVHAVRLMIKTIITNESKLLSDNKISQMLLESEGLNLSRRQVARFREEVGFPNASERVRG